MFGQNTSSIELLIFLPICVWVRSQVPLFVQVQQKWRKMFAGECQGPGVRTDFEMVHLKKAPSQYNHLSGLLDIFKSKIVSYTEQDISDEPGRMYRNTGILPQLKIIKDCGHLNSQFSLF